MNLQVVQQKLDQVILFTLDVRLISGAKRANTEDIEAAKGVVLEKDEVLTLGSKKVFDPEKLREFKRLKDSMHRECMKHGTAFLTGYAVPEERADDLAKALEKIKGAANVAISDLLKNFQKILDDYCDARPTWAATIRANSYTEQYVRSRLSFGFNAVKIVAARSDGVIADNLKGEVGGLLGSVLRDIADEAQLLQNKSLAGKDKKTRKALRPLKAAQDKLKGFAFLDRRVSAIVEMIEAVDKAMPADGPIEGSDLAMLWGVTTILSTPAKALQVAEQFEQDGKDSFLASLKPRAVTMAPEQAGAPVTPSVTSTPAMPALSAAPISLGLFGGMPTARATAAAPQPATAAPQQASPVRGFAALAGLRR